MKVSLVMIVKNEALNIQRCLESAKNIVDEIIIVDTGSTDETKDIALSFGALVFDFKWTNNFAAARNFALKHSSGDINLILDADEYIINGCKEDIIEFAKTNPGCIGKVKFKHSYYEDGIIAYSQEELPRVIPAGVLFSGKIHEQVDTKYPRKETSLYVEHTGYLNTDKSERNLKLILNELKHKPNDNYLLYQAARTYFVSKDYKKADYYFKKCYSSINLSSAYSKTLIVSYLYNLSNLPNIETGLKIIDKQQYNFIDDADFHFACGIYYLNLVLFDTNKYLNYMEYIEESYLKCLEIGESPKNSVIGVGSFKALYNLGTLYEVFGLKEKAITYYKKSSEYGFDLAIKRLEELTASNLN